MTAADAIDTIRMAKNVTRTAALGLWAISVGVTFIYALTTSPEEKVIELISSFISGAIVMLAAYVSLLFIYRFAKDQEKETAEDPKKINEESDT